MNVDLSTHLTETDRITLVIIEEVFILIITEIAANYILRNRNIVYLKRWLPLHLRKARNKEVINIIITEKCQVCVSEAFDQLRLKWECSERKQPSAGEKKPKGRNFFILTVPLLI